MENFDDTQFVSFDISDNSKVSLIEIMHRFSKIGFEVLDCESIRDVKKKYFQYFQEYKRKKFLELKDELFIGEFEEWELINKPTERIILFEDQIKWLSNSSDVLNLHIILTAFAEPENSSIKKITIESDKIREGLFSMSFHNYEIWADNLVIEIIN